MNSKFDQIVNKAIAEHGKLEVTFIRVTDGGERTVEYSTYADFNYQYHVSKIVGKATLVKIERITHDRVFAKNVKYVGAYFIFPEKIVGDNVSASNTYDPLKVLTADNGEKWHIRSLYVQQILEIKYNGTSVFKNSGVFDFSIIGDDGKEYTTVPYAQVLAAEEKQKQRDAEDARRRGNAMLAKKWRDRFIKATTDKAEEEALRAEGLRPISLHADGSVHFYHLGWINGWGYDPEEWGRRWAIQTLHNRECKEHPDDHQMYNREDYWHQTHGFNDYCCTCGYGWAVDSSD